MKKLIKYMAATCLGLSSLSSCSDDDSILKLNPATFVAPTLTSTATSVDLSEATQTETAYVFNWSAANYGVNTTPNYSIEFVKEGGNFNNAKVLTSTQSLSFEVDGTTLNNFVQEQLELTVGTEATVQYRIASTLGTFGSEPLYTETRSITLTPFSTNLSTSWGVVGTFNGWGAQPDAPFWKTKTLGVYEAYVNLQPDNEGNIKFKFRENGSWDAPNGNLGGLVEASSVTATGFSGTVSKTDGDIVAPAAGNYKITFDSNNNTFTAIFFQWGIAGSAATNGWDGPDVQTFTFDGINEVWYANNVTLKEGLFKIRKNNDWPSGNFGLGETVGALKASGADIPVKAGTYNIIFDENKLTYSITPAN